MILTEIAKLLKKPQGGFTLIEIIIVCSVIGILSVLGIAAYNNYNQLQVLQTAANEVATTLNLAKSRALSQQKLGPCALTTRELSGYGVTISTPGTYRLNVFCSGVVGPQILSSKSLPRDISFTSSPSFFFEVLKGGVQTSGQVVLTGYGRTKTVIVDSVGGIRVQ